MTIIYVREKGQDCKSFNTDSLSVLYPVLSIPQACQDCWLHQLELVNFPP